MVTGTSSFPGPKDTGTHDTDLQRDSVSGSLLRHGPDADVLQHPGGYGVVRDRTDGIAPRVGQAVSRVGTRGRVPARHRNAHQIPGPHPIRRRTRPDNHDVDGFSRPAPVRFPDRSGGDRRAGLHGLYDPRGDPSTTGRPIRPPGWVTDLATSHGGDGGR